MRVAHCYPCELLNTLNTVTKVTKANIGDIFDKITAPKPKFHLTVVVVVVVVVVVIGWLTCVPCSPAPNRLVQSSPQISSQCGCGDACGGGRVAHSAHGTWIGGLAQVPVPVPFSTPKIFYNAYDSLFAGMGW